MNSKHREKRRNTRKEVRRFKIDRETFERSSKIRKKKECMRDDESVSIQHLFDAK